MFGYVTPCKMELKIKDYEKFKAYYCGLCKSIKYSFGNVPRMSLNYDMTFLAILLDSLNDKGCEYKKEHCMIHPINKKLIVVNNSALEFAAFFNTILFYYKLIDDIQDDNSLSSKTKEFIMKPYLNKIPKDFLIHNEFTKDKLKQLYELENNPHSVNNLDEISNPFAELTAYILSSYVDNDKDKRILHYLGYNLGKWIYIIDAYDDLEKDMKKNKFNAINSLLNKDNLPFEKFSEDIKDRIEFSLISSARQCLEALNLLNLKKNKDLVENIVYLGLMEKIDKVFKRSCNDYEKSI